MKLHFSLALGLIVGLLLSPGHVIAQEKQDDFSKKFMEALKKYGSPGKEHKHLQPMVGNWNVVAKFYMQPGAEPQVSEGNSKVRWILNKRFLQEVYKGKAFNMPFQGMGLTGYDRQAKKYIGTWCDSMSTNIMHNEGTYDAASKTFTFTATYTDPLTGGKFQSKDIVRILGKNEHTVEMFRRPAGAENADYTKILELRYTRMQGKKKKTK